MRTFVTINGELVRWDESKMKTLNIESNFHGEDVLTFEYEGTVYKSRVIQK